MASQEGMIFDIQHFSLHDGPGIRSTIFFKGCFLQCAWCSNPESWRLQPDILYYRHLCSQCGRCMAACPTSSVYRANDTILFNRDSCTACGTCVSACLAGARTISGKRMTVREICSAIGEYWRIFMQSGGGVTCSGGEVFTQNDFLTALLQALHEERGFHTAIETSGLTSWQNLKTVLPYVDLVLLDIKHMDPEKHRQGTGKDNSVILENAKLIAKSGCNLTIRLPLIPGYNDSLENINSITDFIQGIGVEKLEVMPYHTYGVSKYAALGLNYGMAIHRPDVTPEMFEAATRKGISVHIHQI